MAHIPDGVLSAPVLLTGAAASAGLLAIALRRLDWEALPQAAVLAAAFFVSSLISIPLGPSSVHLLLNGLMGSCWAGRRYRRCSWPWCSRPPSSATAGSSSSASTP